MFERQFQEWKRQREQQKSEPSNDSSDDDKAMLALGAALTIHYERCGGRVTTEQRSAVARTRYELGSEVAAVSREIERSSCSEIKSLYQIMKEAARRTLAQ